ncbi:hypothetical protein CRI94_16410 [Longibacter salinarum]|uniref:Uncharacterized protein n=1 Tax=Longibacter salinarum TaxID=1850348 RepID=A0A2A8CTN2_9BACT|nr:hypothetical protein [Longibacter salinarum]PEN11172.1 hypothetical protein CRI94_16410 [Longibacter salinarum]
MTDEDETLIETYVRRPDALDPTIRQRVEKLVAEDAEASAWARILQSTYEAFDTMSGGMPDVVDRFVDSLFNPPTVLPLTPVDRSRPTVLSADSGQAGPFESIAVLSSKANGVMVRILRDRERDEGRVYVLARDADVYGHALFESGDKRLQVPLPKDGFGRFDNVSEVPEETLQQGWLRRCLWSGPLVAGEAPADLLQIANGYAVRAEWTGPTTLELHSTARSADRPALCWAGIDDGDSVDIVGFEDEMATIVVPRDDETRVLRLFG